ncbi:Metacaspase-1 [Candida viswanathii]|uniref:Metacaspase-1 n=1 Tax=Candida viswanathii TaxID=5486 RepID=A0A367YFL4_9ASCO|nr:Metacaspase-1 [Candida viswanathii]
MFPGQGRHSYNGQQANQGYGQQGYNNQGYDNQGYNGQGYNSQGYNRPSGPPPGQYGSSQGQYNRPSGPPPGQYGSYQGQYNRPSGPPPDLYGSSQGQYNRPSGPPPSNNGGGTSRENYTGEQQDYGHQHGSGNYSRPPQQNQSFGVDNYNYSYSQCSGRKKALLVGINYIGTKNELRGCINDVNNVERFLLNNGFSSDNIVKLTDDQRIQRAIPTRQNILDAIQWLVKDARPNDSLFFHYSGHGGQTEDQPDENGQYDEDDGYDEVIYPLDFETNGFIVDDLLHTMMVKTLPQGCRLTALFDSCHSGSVLDLPYMYSTKGILKEPNVMKECGEGLLQSAMAYASGNKSAMFSGLGGAVKSFINKGKAEKANEYSKQTNTSPADVISLSGCKDDQTSADAKEGGVATGAMSYAFLTVMGQNPNQSYLSLLQNTRDVLQAKYSQKPQLSASHPIDVNLQFII